MLAAREGRAGLVPAPGAAAAPRIMLPTKTEGFL